MLVTHDPGKEMHDIPLDDILVPDIIVGEIGFLMTHELNSSWQYFLSVAGPALEDFC
jgi:hypothetical protein